MNKLRALICVSLVVCGIAISNFAFAQQDDRLGASSADVVPKNIIILFADGTTSGLVNTSLAAIPVHYYDNNHLPQLMS